MWRHTRENMLIVAYMYPWLNILLMRLCFMMKKDHFKQKLLRWPQVPFKKK